MLMSAAFLFSALVQFALALAVAALLGPREFALYSLALAGGILLQAPLLDSLRLAAARLHHSEDTSGLRAMLERLYGRIGLALVAAALAIAALPVDHAYIYALIPLIALTNGFGEFRLALFRAEFDHKRFTRFMVVRNALALLLTPLAAHLFGRAEVALLAFLVATLIATAIEEVRLPPAHPATEAPPKLMTLLRYSGPIVITNVLYYAFFFALRAVVAFFGGLTVAGQFSLALEFVLRLFSSVGTALDLALFPLALKAERESGIAAAEAQARANLEIVLAVLAPMTLGLMLVAPGLEPWLVAPGYRGAFAAFTIALTPGIALYALVQYGLHPFAQVRHETGGLVLAGLAALAGGVCGVAWLARSGALPLPVGMALGGAILAACLMLALRAGRAALPSVRFVASLTACLALLGVVVTPFALMGFTLPLLAAAILLGALAYAGGALALDLAGIRTLLNRRRAGAA